MSARHVTAEPVLGITKEAIGFRRFVFPGLENVSLKQALMTLSSLAAWRTKSDTRPERTRQASFLVLSAQK
jgi:hypothetical protein